MAVKERSIYIDALSFSQERKSGVGYIAEGIAKELIAKIQTGELKRSLYLVVPLGKKKYVSKYESQNVHIKTLPLPGRVFHLLNKLNVLPPLDIFLGIGDYIFPNYRNWRLLFSKSYTYIHDLTFIHYGQYVEPKNLAYLKKNIGLWVGRADVVITSSNYTKREITQYLGIKPGKIAVVPHGIDPRVFYHRSKEDCAPVLKSYGIKEDGYILHVGNIEPRKNIRGLIESYASLPAKIRQAHALVLVGGGGWLNDAEEKAIKDGKQEGLRILRPSGYVEDEDLPFFYSAASVLAMPSYYEGFGLPPLQAIACQTPAIVGDNSSLKELFGSIAELVDPHKTEAITSAIVKTVTANQKVRAAYAVSSQKFARQYDWDKSVDKLLDVLNGARS